MEVKENETLDERKVLSLLDELFPSKGDATLPGMVFIVHYIHAFVLF